MVQKALVNKLQRYRKALQDARIPVEKLILYGSRARGEHRPDSDIDICVVSRTLGKSRFDEIIILNRIGRKIDLLIEAVPCSLHNWRKNKTSPLLHEIHTTGIEVSIGSGLSTLSS